MGSHSTKKYKFIRYSNIFLYTIFVRFLNIWGSSFFFNNVKFDLTEDKIFSISNATTEVLSSGLKNLSDCVFMYRKI